MSAPPLPLLPFAHPGARMPAMQLFRYLRHAWTRQQIQEGLVYTPAVLSVALGEGIPVNRIYQWSTGNGGRASLPMLLRLCAITGRRLVFTASEVRIEPCGDPVPQEQWGAYAAPALHYSDLHRHRIQRAPLYRAVRDLWLDNAPTGKRRTLAGIARRTGTSRNSLSRWASGNQRCNAPMWILILMAWESDHSRLHLHHDRIVIADRSGNTHTTITAGATS